MLGDFPDLLAGGGITGVVGGVFWLIVTLRRTNSDAMKTATEMYRDIADRSDKKNREFEEKLTEVERRVNVLIEQLNIAIPLMREHGVDSATIAKIEHALKGS